MDDWNIKDLNETAPQDSKAKLLLFGDFDPMKERIIRDPYFVSSISNKIICMLLISYGPSFGCSNRKSYNA